MEWRKESLKQVYHSGPGFYCYAPALVCDGVQGQDVILACHNSRPGVIRDDIVGLWPGADGTMTSRPLLTAGDAGAWDSFHVCDPSVLSGRYSRRGRTYACALFYLGNDADACINNQIGVAFADSWEGPWHRSGPPLISYPPRGQWGAGQPCALYDGCRRLLLFYTKGIPGTAGYVREIGLDNAETPRLGVETRLSTSTLLQAGGQQPDYWNNFDVVYDPHRDRFWAIRELHPYPTEAPTNISDTLELLSLPGDRLFEPGAPWQVEGRLSPEVSGHARNHNACFERSPAGALPHPDRIRILFSTSCAAPACAGEDPLWTYDLWEITATIRAAEGNEERGSTLPDRESRPPWNPTKP